MSKQCMGCMEYFPDKLEVCPYCGYIIDSPVEEAVHIVPGSLLHDRYIVGKVLGYGSFGVTYIAWDGKLQRKVAIKEYMPSEFSTRMPGQSCLTIFSGDKSEQFQDGLKKFVDEAKRLAKFNNEPGIVSIFDSFLENETAYIVMEFLDGETLGDRLKREKTEIKGKNGTEIRSNPIPEDEAVSLLLPVMNSLITVHKEGIIHRDIAPDNIFITKKGDVKLIDFGAARYATTSHSRSLTTIVKPGYSPKEQYDSRGDQGPHTDVYALAATLYKMVTGKTPPEAMGRNAACETKHRDPLIEPHKIVKNISEVRENAILNALNIRIEDRTPDIETFIGELIADVPAKRKYGKIKKIDLYNWPLWMKILLPSLAAIIVALGVLLATGVIKFTSLFSDKVVIPDGMVSVPDVENLDKDDAINKIESAQLLAVAGGNVESEYVEAGIIVYQTPDGGSFADINSEIKLIVSAGVGVVEVKDGIATVPYVVWNTQEEAVAKLKQAGLAEPIIKTKSDDNVETGRVISQSKSSGEKVPTGTQIEIVVSTGSAAFDMIDVTGKSLADAKALLEKKSLKVNVTHEKNSSVSEGKVISQSIAAGKKVNKGDTVTLSVSSGKPLVSVANVVGKTQSAATDTLKNQGLKVAVSEEYSSSVENGRVIRQSPDAGTSQIEGSTITIIVSKGKQPVTVSFNANGGNVSSSSKTVYVSSTYGSLPTPSRDYYTFNGWYSSASGGSKVTDSTQVISSSNHTLYAQWRLNDVSNWVLESQVPSGAQKIEEKWTYTKTETITSTSSSSMSSDWTQTGSNWKPTGSGTHYYASLPSGFNTNDSLYSKYNGSALSSYDNGSTKREVSSSSHYTYIYWHWSYPLSGYHSETNRVIGSYYGDPSGSGKCTIWEAFESTTNATEYAQKAYKFTGHSTYSYWWFKESVSKQTYTDYQKEYSYSKTTNLEASSNPSGGSDISNVQKYVKYRAK